MNICSTRDVVHITNLSRTTIWRLERAGEFPRRLQLATNRVGWREEDIQDWIESRPRIVSASASAHLSQSTDLKGG